MATGFLKFKDRFSIDIILKTSKIPVHSAYLKKKFAYRLRRIVYILILDWSFLIFFVVGFFLSSLNPVLIILSIFSLPFALYFIYLQFIKINTVKLQIFKIWLGEVSRSRKLCFEGTNFEKRKYMVYKQDYENFESLLEPIKIAFVSDIHFGKSYYSCSFQKLVRIANIINNLPTDIFIFGGDLLCEDFCEKSFEFFDLIKKRYKFGVFGNHDSNYLKEKFSIPEEFIVKAGDVGMQILVNESKHIEINGKKITIGGVADLRSGLFDLNKVFHTHNNESDDTLLRILVSHNPEIIDYVEEEDKIDLILSGHTHWGQIRLGEGLNLYRIAPIRKYAKLLGGLYQLEFGTKIHISSGAGTSVIRTKIGAENSVELLELYSKKLVKNS
ncbi:hypothetical protein D6810_00130 [Candidatus Dojkabacteria bacterium]|uniref:Calcineurin-like phosphoesterase domain-containing protein n=1 Tax=Candidatus Dojkabacteria bacterium TaxID=2099670 RepID=A0A3M0Z2P4_9BACT|nr:MAG: hypothetical protein D6810_00130 [Candidatus Dojkabacteria bacterium]